MKKSYEVEYISKEGRFTIEAFGSRAAAFKFARKEDWQIIYERINGRRNVIADKFAMIRMKNALDEALKIR